MEARIADLYQLPDITQYQDVDVLILRESCAVLEEKVQNIADCLSNHDRQIIEAYIDIRNELEFETVKTALRWGKNHYK